MSERSLKRASSLGCAVVLLLVVLTPAHSVTVWGIDVKGLEVESSLFLIRNSVADSAPDPVVNTIGLSIPFKVFSIVTFRPEAFVFFQSYGFQSGRAVPLESMFDSVVMMALVINPNVGLEFAVTPFLHAGGEFSLAFLNRIPVFFLGKKGIDQVLDVSGWFIAGRFLYPNANLGFVWQFSEALALTVRGQFFYPVFNLWNAVEYWDQMIFGANVGIRFTF